MKFVFSLILIFYSLASSAESVLCETLHLRSLPAYSEQAKDLQEIIRNSGRSGQETKTFGVARTIVEYIGNFGPEFKKRFEKLTSEEVLLDGGCGDCHLSDALVDSGKGKYVGITFELVNRTLSFFENRILKGTVKLFTGRFFENIATKELKSFGSVKIIADLYGIMSYTERPDLTLKRYLDLLDKDGAIFIFGPSVHVGNDYSFFIYLRKVKGIQLKTAGNMRGETSYIITRTSEPVQIPEIEYSHAQKGVPPHRFYQYTGNFLTSY